MSFFTSLQFCRPTAPPRITTADLARFIRDFEATGAVRPSTSQRICQIKFGTAIDADDQPASWLEETSPWIAIPRDIDWDIETHAPSTDVVAAIESDHRVIYRAFLTLGPAADSVASTRRVPSPENEQELALDGWSIEMGPIRVGDLESNLELDAGWIAVSFAGNGYLYPWTPTQLVNRATAHPAICRVMELCRRYWPVERQPATPTIVDRRAMAGPRWCGSVYAPVDWFWTVNESG